MTCEYCKQEILSDQPGYHVYEITNGKETDTYLHKRCFLKYFNIDPDSEMPKRMISTKEIISITGMGW